MFTIVSLQVLDLEVSGDLLDPLQRWATCSCRIRYHIIS